MKMENITQVLDTHEKDLEVKTQKEVHVHLQWAQKIQDRTNYLERQKHLDIFDTLYVGAIGTHIIKPKPTKVVAETGVSQCYT